MFQNKPVKIFAIVVVVLSWILSLGWFLNSYAQSQNDKSGSISSKMPEISIIANQNPNEIHNFADQEYPNIDFLNNAVTFDNQVASLAQPSPDAVASNPAPNSTLPMRPSNGQDFSTSGKISTPNTLEFSKLGIQSPLIYATMADIFETNPDGSINTNKPIQENLKNGPLSTPVQRLLTQGIVHLPFTPNPGETGNSYIVGHSSNYASVKSVYNQIFKNLNKAKIGDEFIIYSYSGKGLIFRVFESIVVNTADVDKAYQNFDSRRVVTLQASVLIGGKPLKRLLVRGELTN